MIPKEFVKEANIFARKFGYHRATKVTLGYETRFLKTQEAGYRKYTTGEYVSKSYRNNFGWKNTYYQHLICEFEINVIKH